MGKLSLLHRLHVALSCRFLGSHGSCHRLIPHGLHVSMAIPSTIPCSKLSVHIVVCWKGTPKASFSALMVTGILLLTLCIPFVSCCPETHTIKWRRRLPRVHIFLRGILAFKRPGPTQHGCFCSQWALCPLRAHCHFSAHWHNTFVYLISVWCLQPKCSSDIFRVMSGIHEMWRGCEIRNSVYFLEP